MKTKLLLILSALAIIFAAIFVFSHPRQELEYDFQVITIDKNADLLLDGEKIDFDLPISSDGMRAPYLTNWIRHTSIVDNNDIYDLKEKRKYSIGLNNWERLLDYDNKKLLLETMMGLEIRNLDTNESILQLEKFSIDSEDNYIECLNAILLDDKIICQQITRFDTKLIQIKFDGKAEEVYKTSGNILSFITDSENIYVYELINGKEHLVAIDGKQTKINFVHPSDNTDTTRIFWQLFLDDNILKILFVNYVQKQENGNISLLDDGISVAEFNSTLEDPISIKDDLYDVILLK
jgi:hypothetical protein